MRKIPKGELMKLLESLSAYKGDEFGFFIVAKGKNIAACSNNYDRVPSMLACIFSSEEGRKLFRSVLEFISINSDEETLEELRDIVDEELFDEEECEEEYCVNGNEKCNTCFRFIERKCGFGHCSFLRRDIDGEETNATNSNNRNGCGSYRKDDKK